MSEGETELVQSNLPAASKPNVPSDDQSLRFVEESISYVPLAVPLVPRTTMLSGIMNVSVMTGVVSGGGGGVPGTTLAQLVAMRTSSKYSDGPLPLVALNAKYVRLAGSLAPTALPRDDGGAAAP